MYYQVWKHPLGAQFKVKYKITLLLSNSLGPKDDFMGLSFGQGMDFLLKYQCLSYCEMVYLAPPIPIPLLGTGLSCHSISLPDTG